MSQVLPALLEELRNEAVQALALPLVLRIIAQQPPRDFMDVTLPALLPVATTVKVTEASACHQCSLGSPCYVVPLALQVSQGEALALFTAGAILLAPSLPPEAIGSLIVPLLARAADHGVRQHIPLPTFNVQFPQAFARVRNSNEPDSMMVPVLR